MREVFDRRSIFTWCAQKIKVSLWIHVKIKLLALGCQKCVAFVVVVSLPYFLCVSSCTERLCSGGGVWWSQTSQRHSFLLLRPHGSRYIHPFSLAYPSILTLTLHLLSHHVANFPILLTLTLHFSISLLFSTLNSSTLMAQRFLLFSFPFPSRPSPSPSFPPLSFPLSPGLGPRHYTVHLRAVLLLQFMEHLDKLMYNAYEGSCVTLPPVPKVRSIFQVFCEIRGTKAMNFFPPQSAIATYFDQPKTLYFFTPHSTIVYPLWR